MLDVVHDLPNRDGNPDGQGMHVRRSQFMTFLTGMETCYTAPDSFAAAAFMTFLTGMETFIPVSIHKAYPLFMTFLTGMETKKRTTQATSGCRCS